MGVYTIVADNLENSPAKLMADEQAMISITDVDALVDFCRKEKVDGVMNFCNDLASKVQYQVAEALGLPSIGNASQVLALTDKKVFKQLCVDNGLDIIESYTEEEVLAGEAKYPLLVKPADSRGSRGISVCKNEADFVKAVEIAIKESSSGQIVIEQYMYGKQDFTVTYLVKDGEPYLVRTGDRYLGREEDGLQRQCAFSISPSYYTDLYLKNVDLGFRKLLKKIGIQNGPVFVQGFIDGETVRFYDPGIRFPGTEFERILDKACGLNIMKKMISYALENCINDDYGELEDAYKLNGNCGILLMVDSRPGTIGKILGIDEITKLPEIVYVAQKAKEGDVIPPSGDVKQRIIEIALLVKQDYKAICSIINTIQSKIIVEDENGENLLVPFDTSKLIY